MFENYKPIVDTLQILSPTAHIGGGAVRDSLLKRPIRDVDLFIDSAVTDPAAQLLRSKFGFIKVSDWMAAGYYRKSVLELARVATFEKADETIPIQLIGLNGPTTMQQNIGRFDFGACMAGWDGDQVCTTEQFKIDVYNETFTLCRAESQWQYDNSMRRFQKFTAERYAGWKLRVPSEFESFARDRLEKRASLIAPLLDGLGEDDMKAVVHRATTLVRTNTDEKVIDLLKAA